MEKIKTPEEISELLNGNSMDVKDIPSCYFNIEDILVKRKYVHMSIEKTQGTIHLISIDDTTTDISKTSHLFAQMNLSPIIVSILDQKEREEMLEGKSKIVKIYAGNIQYSENDFHFDGWSEGLKAYNNREITIPVLKKFFNL